MANLPSSPLVMTKLLELSSYCPEGSKYLGSVDISLTSDRFICVTRRHSCWTLPAMFMLDLEAFNQPFSASTIALDLDHPSGERTAQFRVNENGQFVVLYDNQNIWIQDLQIPNSVARLLPLKSESNIRLVKWSGATTVVVVTNKHEVYNFDVRTVDAELQNLLPHILPFETKRIADYFSHGRWSASTNILFENGQVSGILNLDCAEETVILSGFAGAFASFVDSDSNGDEDAIFIYANSGSDIYSLSIAAVHCSKNKSLGESISSPKWMTEFRNPRLHDIGYTDLPIAMHISPQNTIIFIVTKLSYVHLFQLSNGSHLGSIRVSPFRVSASALCSKNPGIIVIDENGMVFRISLDVQEWILRLNIASKNNLDKLSILLFAIKNDIPITITLFYEFFPNFSSTNAQAYQNAVELTAPLSGDDLLKLFTKILEENPTMLHFFRLLAQKCSEKAAISDLISLFKTYGDAGDVFAFLNCLRVSSLKGSILAEYVESAIETKHYNVLEYFLSTSEISDPDTVLQILKRNVDSEPNMVSWTEKFCDRFDFVEDLMEAYMRKDCSQSEFSILKLIEKSDSKRVNRIFKFLMERNIFFRTLLVYNKTLLEKFLAAVDPDAFTPDLLKIFGEYDLLKIGIKCLEGLVAQPESDTRLVNLLMNTYHEDVEGCEARTNAFFKSIGQTRCHEIGQKMENENLQFAAMIYKSCQCDSAYIKLCSKHNLSSDLAVYALTRASTELWLELLSSQDQKAIYYFNLPKFKAELFRSPFPAVKALVTALAKAGLPTHPLPVISSASDCLINTQFQDKRERGFIQECIIAIWVTRYPQELNRIRDLINDHKDYDHVKVLTDLLMKKMIVPAQIIICRLMEKEIEVTANDIAALTSVALSFDEKSIWTIIGNFHMERHELYSALVAYINGQYHLNYIEVLEEIKSVDNFEHWNTAVTYLQMVDPTGKDAKVSAALSIVLVRSNHLEKLEGLFSSLMDKLICEVCFDEPKKVLLVPCNHVVCVNCARKLVKDNSSCPLCRGPIRDTQTVYF